MVDATRSAPFRAEVEALHGGFETLSAAARAMAAEPAPQTALQRARTLRRRAGFELGIDPRRSLKTLMEARRLEGSMRAPDDRREHAVREMLASCHALEATDVAAATAILDPASAPPIDESEGFGRQLLIPWLIAVGETARAREWSELAKRHPMVTSVEWRRCQADLLDRALAAADGRPPEDSGLDQIEVPSPATWLRLQIACYWGVVTGNVDDARFAAHLIGKLTPYAPRSFRAQQETCDVMFNVLDGQCDVDLATPAYQLALFNIGPILAGAEAIAVGGTSASAASWQQWFAGAWPAHILRAPGWPVLVHRVRALLACRAGDAMTGLRLMGQAIKIADRIGAQVEGAVARVQYAELLAVDPRPDARERWFEVSQAGQAGCQALGIPFEHHAHRARRAATLARFDQVSRASRTLAAASAHLTSREIEVLRLFSAGYSYREAAEQLDVGWRTVQSHAYNAYQKLGVSSKITAVAAASQQGLL